MVSRLHGSPAHDAPDVSGAGRLFYYFPLFHQRADETAYAAFRALGGTRIPISDPVSCRQFPLIGILINGADAAFNESLFAGGFFYLHAFGTHSAMAEVLLHMKQSRALGRVMLHGRHKLEIARNQEFIKCARPHQTRGILLTLLNVVK